jgi:membrane-bound lytic murein transglycosylase A
MVAQDTGSAITGPARADIYFGPGAEAGRLAGRLRHHVHFVILVPKSLEPAARGRKMPLPDARPSEKIAKLFPQVDPLKNGTKPPEKTAATAGAKDTAKAAEPAKAAAPTAAQPPAGVAQASTTQTAAAKTVPLPEVRPDIKPSREVRRRYITRYRRGR